MRPTILRSAALAAAAVAILAVTGAAAQAQTAYPGYSYGPGPSPQPYGDTYRPLTVNPRHAPRGYARAGGYDPYSGPATIVTAPVDIAGRLVALPFQVVNSIFPPRSNTPLVIVGAPVYAAGQIAQAPFNLLQAPFGRPGPYMD